MGEGGEEGEDVSTCVGTSVKGSTSFLWGKEIIECVDNYDLIKGDRATGCLSV